jgi:AcrR family transcriptional regulator
MASEVTDGTEAMLAEARRLGPGSAPAREAAQRELLLRAMTSAAAAKGYAGSRVEDVVELSGLSRATFYLHFRDKEECLLAAFEWCGAVISEQIERALGGAEGTRARVEAGVGALVELAVETPEVVRMALIEARGGMTASREAQLRWMAELGGLVAEDAGGAEEAWLRRMAFRAAVAIVALEVAAGRADALPGMQSELVDAALTPCVALGSESATADRRVA